MAAKTMPVLSRSYMVAAGAGILMLFVGYCFCRGFGKNSEKAKLKDHVDRFSDLQSVRSDGGNDNANGSAFTPKSPKSGGDNPCVGDGAFTSTVVPMGAPVNKKSPKKPARVEPNCEPEPVCPNQVNLH